MAMGPRHRHFFFLSFSGDSNIQPGLRATDLMTRDQYFSRSDISIP